MAIEWDDTLATGHTLIDTQHKELFRRVNGLLTACAEGHGREAVIATLAYLEDYTRKHFSAEEQEMRLAKYTDLESHRRAHLEFIGSVSELRTEVEKAGTGTYLVVTTNRVVVDWLLSHVKKRDKAFAEWLRRK
jgi:hemerythrin